MRTQSDNTLLSERDEVWWLISSISSSLLRFVSRLIVPVRSRTSSVMSPYFIFWKHKIYQLYLQIVSSFNNIVYFCSLAVVETLIILAYKDTLNKIYVNRDKIYDFFKYFQQILIYISIHKINTYKLKCKKHMTTCRTVKEIR